MKLAKMLIELALLRGLQQGVFNMTRMNNITSLGRNTVYTGSGNTKRYKRRMDKIKAIKKHKRRQLA